MNISNADWINNQTIYEVNLRQYTSDGTISSFRKHLPRIKRNGFWDFVVYAVTPYRRKKQKR